MSDIDTKSTHAGDTLVAAPMYRPLWGAVVSGTMVATSGQLLFGVLGIALGLSSVDAYSADAGDGEDLAVGGAAWWLITGTIAMVLGGLTLGRFIGTRRKWDVWFHGLTVWAATAVLGALVVAGGLGLGAGGAAAAMPSANRIVGATGVTGEPLNNGAAGTNDRATANEPVTIEEAEATRRYARNTAWVTFTGLTIGIFATIGAAFAAAKHAPVGLRVPPTSSAQSARRDLD
ncbi:MAG: hypothetical protein SFZ23_12220 [Planctomycetota bacterium]|nr:hypothetical protein [Planctomycetota bacterium]